MNTLKTTMSKIAQIEQPERTDLAKHEDDLALLNELKLSKWQEQILLMTEKESVNKYQIELSNLTELNEIYKKGKSAVEKAKNTSLKLNDSVSLWNKTISQLQEEINLIEDSIVTGRRYSSDIKKAAKELGIDSIPFLQQAENDFTDFTKIIVSLKKSVNDYKNKINSSF